MQMTKEIYNIMVIEDDLSEQKIISMLIRNAGFTAAIKFLNNGEDAIRYINEFGDDPMFSRIHLIFLDLNLPKINGIEVLKTIKKNDLLCLVPLIVLTTSNSKSDVINAYSAGASGYVRKPSVIDDYEKVINHILKYWLEICITP